jgi:hypothetical protein
MRIPPHLQDWIDARKRHHLSHAHVQMARELGMNPKELGKLDNHKQEPWKATVNMQRASDRICFDRSCSRTDGIRAADTRRHSQKEFIGSKIAC